MRRQNRWMLLSQVGFLAPLFAVRIRHPRALACAAVFAMGAALPSVCAAQSAERVAAWPAVVTYVVDGDSIWVRPTPGRSRVKLRLLGIDAPEICQRQGVQARAALQQLALNQPVQVTVHARDPYGRALATVERAQDGLDLSHAMVSAGWAWADRFRRQHPDHEAQEAQARAAQRGVFSQPDAQSPSQFRRVHGPCAPANR